MGLLEIFEKNSSLLLLETVLMGAFIVNPSTKSVVKQNNKLHVAIKQC